MTVSLIAAVSENNVVGCMGSVPWRIPEDLERVKRLTMGHHLIMGRVTFESIGRPLPGRTSIVLTRRAGHSGCESSLQESCLVVHSLEDALVAARKSGETEAFIFGGAEVYRSSLPFTERIYLTRIHQHFEGDAYFPVLGPEWREINREEHNFGRQFAYSFVVLEK